MDKAPFRSLTRGIPEAIEQTPAHLAMMQGQQYIPTTFGDLASRLLETGEVEPTLEAACDFLMITPDDIRDPELQFESEYAGADYTDRLKNRWKSEYIASEGPKGKAFDTFMSDAVAEWVNPDLREIGAVLQKEVNEAPFPETEEEDQELILKQMKASAYHSGVAISPGQLIEKALSFNGPQTFTAAEIASAALVMLEDLYHTRGLDKETKLSDIVLGADLIGEFRSVLAWDFHKKANQYAETKFDRVKGLFLAPHIGKHFLLVGGEK